MKAILIMSNLQLYLLVKIQSMYSKNLSKRVAYCIQANELAYYDTTHSINNICMYGFCILENINQLALVWAHLCSSFFVRIVFELDEFPVLIDPGFFVNWPMLSLFGLVGGFGPFFFRSRDFLVPVLEAKSVKLVYFYFMLFCWHEGISLSVFVL